MGSAGRCRDSLRAISRSHSASVLPLRLAADSTSSSSSTESRVAIVLVRKEARLSGDKPLEDEAGGAEGVVLKYFLAQTLKPSSKAVKGGKPHLWAKLFSSNTFTAEWLFCLRP